MMPRLINTNNEGHIMLMQNAAGIFLLGCELDQPEKSYRTGGSAVCQNCFRDRSSQKVSK